MSAIGDFAMPHPEHAPCPRCRWTRPVTDDGRMAQHLFVDVNGHEHDAVCRGAGRPIERRFDR